LLLKKIIAGNVDDENLRAVPADTKKTSRSLSKASKTTLLVNFLEINEQNPFYFAISNKLKKIEESKLILY
jgi:hypothetical protein